MEAPGTWKSSLKITSFYRLIKIEKKKPKTLQINHEWLRKSLALRKSSISSLHESTWHCVHSYIEKAHSKKQNISLESQKEIFTFKIRNRRQFRKCNLKAPTEILLEPVSHVLNFTRSECYSNFYSVFLFREIEKKNFFIL